MARAVDAVANMRNSLTIWCDNMLQEPEGYRELTRVSCGPFDELLRRERVGVSVQVQVGADGRLELVLFVGRDGADCVVARCPFNFEQDFAEVAGAAVGRVVGVVGAKAVEDLYV